MKMALQDLISKYFLISRTKTKQVWLVIFIFAIVMGEALSVSKTEQQDLEIKKRKICIGTTGRMSVPSNKEHHYRNLRERYANCTYVDGNLELTWIQEENVDLSFLQHIREVTGYVLIAYVDVRQIILPNLQIIRGRTLFKLTVHDKEFALMVTLSKSHYLEMPALRDILSGSVGILSNYNLCHVKTIRWDEIITGVNAQYHYMYNFTEPERSCTPCHESCEGGCWGDGPENCQKFSKVNCSPQCHQGRCFGSQPRECCHLFCAGGCTGPKQSDCLACRNFYDDGVCKQECPSMQRYNPITYSWESNPDGKYAYGATCVKNCPEHLLKDNGACVRFCPPKKKAQNGECVPCDGPCPKPCNGVDVVHANNIESFRDCTIIEGSLTILDSSFNGYQHVYPNFTFGPNYPKMHPDELEIFSTLKEVTGFINIQASNPDFTNLSYFRNLEIIGGRSLTEFFSSLYIVKTSLQYLGLRSLTKIRSGSVAILENKDLCFAKDINWRKLMRQDQANIYLQSNGADEECATKNLICHPECASDGCWGPGETHCLSCSNYALGDTCISSCNESLGLYHAGDNICKPCHEECEHTCTGPGPGSCTKCMNVKDGPYCVSECPSMKYNDSGKCFPCHSNCRGGCSGPVNTVGDNGCHSCDKAVLSPNGSAVDHCLKVDEPCPEGHYYYEVTNPQEAAFLKPLAGKTVCKKCHPRCKNCSGYGFHISVCHECANYRSREQCEDSCPTDYYPDVDNHVCVECAYECRDCYGPGTTRCKACKNLRVPLGSNVTGEFNCTMTCPPEKPYKVISAEFDAYCSEEDPTSEAIKSRIYSMLPGYAIALIVVSVLVIIITFAIIGFKVYLRKKDDDTFKMMRIGGFVEEPLKVTNIKPNLAKLRIIKEAELRRGGILGFGAFGTVYKGVWIPEGENIKIPVAIKVLREGTGTNTNKEVLEEAYIMATVEHPNLLQLLAICMTSQVMLVTQLMPLGSLLDYVRNHKEKIGSKPFLNWCTQIARGMAYLEEKRLVHRDLAARNVLIQNPGMVKITDFGLAKWLDVNVDEYKAAGGKMPVKWLALESIQHRIFTHKSDVWSFGVTVWELLTYGERPYDNIPAREVPDLLDKGERLQQPKICTIDVYMVLIKCWVLDAESRPAFRELADEFAKMSQDPGRYLVIPGDRLMRLPSYTPQDERELIRNLSVPTDGPEVMVYAEEYLQPSKPDELSHTMSSHIRHHSTTESTGTMSPPPTPLKKYPDHPIDYSNGVEGRESPMSVQQLQSMRAGRYAHLDAAIANAPTNRPNDGSLHSRYSSDPVKQMIVKDDNSLANGMASLHRDFMKPSEIRIESRLDEDDYLMPSTQPNMQPTTYMDLIGDPKSIDGVDGSRMPIRDNRYVPEFVSVTVGVPTVGLDNPEYHIMNNSANINGYANMQPQPGTANGGNSVMVGGRPRRKNTSSEDDSDHEYYNDFDRLQRELQPLNHLCNETTV